MSSSLRFEDACKPVELDLFQCVKCGKCYYKEEEARYCCADDIPCSICGTRHNNGKRIEPERSLCNRCLTEKHFTEQKERWYNKKEYDWDGKYPLTVWDDDVYFFSEDDILVYLENTEAPTLEDIWFELCREVSDEKPYVDLCHAVEDYLRDHEDYPNFPQEVKEAVSKINNYFDEYFSSYYIGTGKRAKLSSIRDRLSDEIVNKYSISSRSSSNL